MQINAIKTKRFFIADIFYKLKNKAKKNAVSCAFFDEKNKCKVIC